MSLTDSFPEDAPTVALLPWGDLFEDYLDPIGTSFETFVSEASGGWLFGYIEALHAAGVRSVMVCVSRTAIGAPGGVLHRVHAPTGAPIYALAPSALYRLARRAGRIGAMSVAPYLATPLRLLAAVLRKERCRAILCQEYEYPRFDACVVLGRLLRMPVFATFQGGDGSGATRLQRLLRPLALRASEGICIASASERARVRARYRLADSHITAIANPLSADVPPTVTERRAARRALGLPQDALVVVWHGRVERRRKGMDILMETWRRLTRRHPRPDSLHLLLLGTGQESDWLHSEIDREPGGGRIHWTDRYVQDRGEIRRFLLAGDVYVFPSRHEGFAVAPMEAMAAGLPLVASAAVPGLGDLMGVPEGAQGPAAGPTGGGILVPGEDPEDFAAALLSLLEDDETRARMGDWARRRVAAQYSPSTVGAQLRQWLFPHEDTVSPVAGAWPA